MSTEVLRLSGNYIIQAVPGGSVLIDPTGSSATTGTVTINGNLVINGAQTQVEKQNVSVKDKVILLNDGEVGPGIGGLIGSGQQSGIQVDRGHGASSTLTGNLVLTELAWNDGVNNHQGIWEFTVGNGVAQAYSAIKVNAIQYDGEGSRLDGRLIIFGNQVGMLNVGTQGDETGLSYASRVTDENDIPNKYYVDHVVSQATEVAFATSATFIQEGNSSVIINDYTKTGQTSNIIAFIDNVQTVYIEPDTVALAGIAITSSTIRTSTTNTDLILLTNGTGNIIANAAISYQVPDVPPTSTPNQVKVYSTSTPGAGASGLLYVNTLGTDELTGARRAMVFSMIL